MRAELPRQDATFQYDRLYQLVEANTHAGQIEYEYDTIQNLIRRTVSDPLEGPPGGTLLYGAGGAGPNQLTNAFQVAP